MHFGVCDNAKLFPRFSTLFLHKKNCRGIEEIEHCVVVQQASKLTLETSSNHPSTDKLKLGPK